MNPTDTTEVHESSDSSSSAEEPIITDPNTGETVDPIVDSDAPAETKEYSVIRGLIDAFVACMNTHCNGVGASEADTKIAALKAQFAEDRKAAGTEDNRFAEEGDPLTLTEQDHLDTIFQKVKESPAPSNRHPDAPVMLDAIPEADREQYSRDSYPFGSVPVSGDHAPERAPLAKGDLTPAPYPGIGGGIAHSQERPQENVQSEPIPSV